MDQNSQEVKTNQVPQETPVGNSNAENKPKPTLFNKLILVLVIVILLSWFWPDQTVCTPTGGRSAECIRPDNLFLQFLALPLFIFGALSGISFFLKVRNASKALSVGQRIFGTIIGLGGGIIIYLIALMAASGVWERGHAASYAVTGD